MFPADQNIKNFDPDLWQALEAERQRQEDHIELIASENYTSPRVLQAQGSVLTNKYAEGYPGKRYYGGCEYVDIAERLAIDRAKALFKARGRQCAAAFRLAGKSGGVLRGVESGRHDSWHVAGAWRPPDARLAGESLAESSTTSVSYGLTEAEDVDYDQVAKLAQEHKPKMIVAGASAYSLTFDWKRFRQIADSIGAYLFVDMAHYAGLIAAGLYPTPVGIADFVSSTTHKTLRGPRGGIILAKAEHEKIINSAIFPGIQGGPLMHVIAAKAVAFKEAMAPEFRSYQMQVIANARTMAKTLQSRGLRVVSGRTDCHMFLVDLRAKKITGKDAEAALGRANITVNKNAIPNDPEKPFVTSGVRIGSPAVTTRGFRELEAEKLSNLIADVLEAPNDDAIIDHVRGEVGGRCARSFRCTGR